LLPLITSDLQPARRLDHHIATQDYCIFSPLGGAMPTTAPTFRKMVEDLPALDVLELYHAGGLVHGVSTILQWPPSTTVHIRADHGRLIVAINGGLEVVVQVEYLALIGDRPHVRCPACDRRTYRLYLDGDWFGCRQCAGLAYAVRYERRWSPALQRVHKLRARLGAELTPFAPLPPRPYRGLAGPWHDRMVAQIQAAEAEVLEALRKTTAVAARLHRDE
jgi:hypothetical protein